MNLKTEGGCRISCLSFLFTNFPCLFFTLMYDQQKQFGSMKGWYILAMIFNLPQNVFPIGIFDLMFFITSFFSFKFLIQSMSSSSAKNGFFASYCDLRSNFILNARHLKNFAEAERRMRRTNITHAHKNTPGAFTEEKVDFIFIQ